MTTMHLVLQYIKPDQAYALSIYTYTQVHRLNPVAYEADCQKAIHQVIRPSGRQAFKFSDGTDSQSK